MIRCAVKQYPQRKRAASATRWRNAAEMLCGLMQAGLIVRGQRYHNHAGAGEWLPRVLTNVERLSAME
jgi:hypothetical protein